MRLIGGYRPGLYGSLIAPGSQILGSAAGRTFSPGNLQTAVLAAVSFTLIATATVGNRALTVRALDAAAGNNLMQVVGGVVIASSTTRFCFGSGIAAFSGNGIVTASLPVEFPLPVGAQIQIFDAANIDVNDALSLVAVVFAS